MKNNTQREFVLQKRKPLSEETKIKIGNANRGRKLSEERKIQIGLKSRWNTYRRGKKMTKESIEKMKKSHSGCIAWNKGLTKETDSRIAKYSKTIKEKGIKPTQPKGYKHSE